MSQPLPEALHLSPILPLQLRESGVQAAKQVPVLELHPNMQELVLVQPPFSLQVWAVWASRHCLSPGPHTPVHAPPMQVRFDGHADGVAHCPVGEQSETALPAQCFWFGAHTPAQAPFTQVFPALVQFAVLT